jgi:hypothetical protein
MTSSASPVKLQYDEDTHNKHHQTVRPDTIRKLAQSLFPDETIQMPGKPSPLKPPTVPKWRRADQSIITHLSEVKRISEIQVRRGYMTSQVEYYDTLLDSVCTDDLVDWHKLHGPTYNKDPVMLTVLLLEHFHSPFTATSAYHTLVNLPVGHTHHTLNSFLAEVETLAPKIGELLSPSGLCVEVMRHVHDDIVTRLDLHAKVTYGLGITHMIALLRNEVTKNPTGVTPGEMPARAPPPNVRFMQPPTPASSPAPDAMNVDAVAIVNAVFNGMKGNNNWTNKRNNWSNNDRNNNWTNNRNNNNNSRNNARVPHSSGQLCRMFRAGNCTYGEKCIHLHQQSN